MYSTRVSSVCCGQCVYLFSHLLFVLVIQELSPNVIITSAKQEHSLTKFIEKLGKVFSLKNKFHNHFTTVVCYHTIKFPPYQN